MRTVFLEFRDRETKKSRVVGSDAIFIETAMELRNVLS